jgi:hypothetical protein
MFRSGRYIQQLRGYKAFIPTSLPPEPALSCNTPEFKQQEQSALLSLARLDLLYSNEDKLIIHYY